MSLSNYQETAFLATLPGTVHVSLHTGDPGEDGTANLVAGSTRGSVTLGAAAGNVRATNAALAFLNWAWGAAIVSHIALWDASTSGNCIGSGALAVAKTLANTDSLNFASGAITITLD